MPPVPDSQEKLSTGTHHKLELNSLVWFQLCQLCPVLACCVAQGHAAALLPLTRLPVAHFASHIHRIHIEGPAEVQ